MKRTACLALLGAAITLTHGARAEPTAEDRASAQQLYDDAGKLMRAERWSEACPKLEASEKLDPAIGTSLRLAYCYENEGKTASAWAMFTEAQGMALKAGDRRAEDAGKRARLLEPKLSRLLLDVAPEDRAAGVEIRREGKVVDPAVWSTAVPVDPGEHTIEASKQGKQTWKTTVTIAARPGVTTVSIPALVDAPATASAPEVSHAPPYWGAQRISGLAVGGVGLAGLVIGTVFGVQTLHKTSDAKAYCSATQPYCQPAGVTLESDAKTTAKIADATIAVGGAAVVGGLILFLTSPSGAPKASGGVRVVPVVGAGQAGLSAVGRW